MVEDPWRRIVISGASGGIGAALAEQLAVPDVTFLLLGRDLDRLDRVSRVCSERGARVTTASIDVTDREGLSDVVSGFMADGAPDLVVAAAGWVTQEGLPTDAGPDWGTLRRQLAVNLDGVVNLLEVCLTERTVGGHRPLEVVLVSSLNALFPVGEAPGYGAAKAAIANLAEALDDFYGCRASPGRPVVFRVAYPGFVATSMAEGYAGPRPFEITARQAAQRILRGVRQGRRRIIFPRRLGSLVLISHLLPRPWLRRLVSAERAYRKG